MITLQRPLFLVAALACTAAAHAIEVASLPYVGTPDWTDIVFGGTSMIKNGAGTETTLTTAASRGVWFGNSPGSSNPANWTIAGNAAGNYLSLTARFSANAADWSAYLHDATHQAAFSFAPTGCVSSCYSETAQSGYSITHALDAGGKTSTFISADLSRFHTFEWLLKGGQVYYRVDGIVVYAGAAHASTQSAILVIGDGSGSTTTGLG